MYQSCASLQASEEKDRKDILAEIEAGMGPTTVNLALKRSLVDSARCERCIKLVYMTAST